MCLISSELDFTDLGSGLSGLVFKSLMCWLVKDPTDGLGLNAVCCLLWTWVELCLI